MKTDAIQNVINKHLEQNECSPVACEANIELEALETALAAKDEALRQYADRTEWGYDENDDVFCSKGWEIAKAALSPPTGKVLIDIEKLREIEWSAFRGTEDGLIVVPACPVCREGEDGAHCANCWLGKLLNDA